MTQARRNAGNLLNDSYVTTKESLCIDNSKTWHYTKTNTPWAVAIAEWLEWLHAGGMTFETRRLRSKQLRRFAALHNGDPFEVTLDDLVSYLANPDWSTTTKRSAKNAVSSFYKWAYVNGYVEANPAVSLPKISVPLGKPRPAGELAIRQGLRDADDRVALMLKLAAYQGLRAGEISRIHSDDIVDDLLGQSLRVRGKGGKVRLVPLDEQLAEELRDQTPGWLFPGRIEGHISAGYASKLISKALPPGITAHMLRHRFAGVAYKGTGNDIRAVQELLGHASVATTQIYTPVMNDALRMGVQAAAS